MTTRIFISAGEASGDLLAAKLVESMHSIDSTLEFFGLTGPSMEKAGVFSLLSIEHLAFMGFFEVLKKVPFILRLENKILSEISRVNPKVAILVDYPGLHFRLAPKIRALGVKVVQYVAPKVWAWGYPRVHLLRESFDMVLGVLPFEQNFFEVEQVNYTYVGSPHKERVDSITNARKFLDIEPSLPLVGLLPGSRKGEIDRIFPDMVHVAEEMHLQFPELLFLIPVAPGLSIEYLSNLLKQSFSENLKELEPKPWGKKIGPFYLIKGKSLEVMSASNMAIVASGTATLECGLLQTPMVVMYKMSQLTYLLAKRKVELNYFSLINLMLSDSLVPEYIQEYKIADIAFDSIGLLDENSRKRRDQLTRFKNLYESLQPNAEKLASEKILGLVS